MKGISLKRDIMTTSYACTCSSDTTRLLVALGANIRATDKNKDTPLHHAAANLNYGATKVLIDAGAPIEVKNNDVRSCMCVLQCVAKQCHIHAHTHSHSQGKTPYDLAMENQNVYDMDQLLMARQKRSPQGVLEYFTRDPVSVPFVCVFNVHVLVCRDPVSVPFVCVFNVHVLVCRDPVSVPFVCVFNVHVLVCRDPVSVPFVCVFNVHVLVFLCVCSSTSPCVLSCALIIMIVALCVIIWCI